MLLRLRVKNFKSFNDCEIRFGPFTCLVGANGVGKSNVFDAIHFLRSLASSDIQTAAQSIRTTAGGMFSPQELFWSGNTSEPLEFEVDMLVPQEVRDDFGRTAEPATTLLRYNLQLRLAADPHPRLEIAHESLRGLRAGDAKSVLGFDHSTEFRRSVVKPTRRLGPLVSTRVEGDGLIRLMLHQDGGSRGQPIPAGASPRTVVGGTNAAEYPTVLAARREMASWELLHLEPSTMRTPDQLGGPARVDERGGHIAATLDRLVRSEPKAGQTLQTAANRLAELVPEVIGIDLDRDEVRQQLSVVLQMRSSSVALGPRSLSDGTLRFLALVTLWLDPEAGRLLCMEEPENGLHPARVPAAVSLLEDFAVDSSQAVDIDNPARQVIINTHSPDVVRRLDPENLLFVDASSAPKGLATYVRPVAGGWRGIDGVAIQSLKDFIGGGPLGPAALVYQTELNFGTAR